MTNSKEKQYLSKWSGGILKQKNIDNIYPTSLTSNIKALQHKNADDGTAQEPLNYMKHIPKSPAMLEPGANPFRIVHNIQNTMRWSLERFLNRLQLMLHACFG